MKNRSTRVFGLLLALVLTLPVFAVKNSIAAVIGDYVLTTAEFNDVVRSIAALDSNAAANEQLLRKQLMDTIVQIHMQVNVAKQMGVSLSDEEKQELIQSQKKPVKILRSKGFSGSSYLAFIQDQFLAQKVMQMTMRERTALDQATVDARKAQKIREARQYYVKDIVFDYNEDVLPQEKMQYVQDWQNKWSKQKITAKMLPKELELHVFQWSTLDELPDLFKEHLLKMKRKQVSIPFKAGNGWHMLKLVGKRDKPGVHLDDESIRKELFMENINQNQKKWMQSLAQQQYVEIKSLS